VFDMALLFRSSTSPMVIALMDPVTAIVLTFFPYFLADLKRFVFLPTTTKNNLSASCASQKQTPQPPSVGKLRPKRTTNSPLNTWLLKMRLKVRVCWVVWHGGRDVQYIVVVTLLEDLVKDAFSRVVGDLDKVDL
jgi:hypothetical protein